MKKTIFFLTLKLTVLMGIIFIIHLGLIYNFNIDSEGIFLLKSYIVNTFLAFFSFSVLHILNKRFNLFFVYCITVLIKVAAYIHIFYPEFYLDSILSKKEFMIFFIPYFIGLLFEVSSFRYFNH
jgi:hypothetical protein